MCLHLYQCTKVEEYLRRWRGVTAHYAAKRLILLGYGNDVLTWKRPERTPREILHSNWFVQALARNVGTFYFMGGPPGDAHSYRGTMLTFLVDRLLYLETK